MSLDSLMKELESIRIEADQPEYIEAGITEKRIILALIKYINNKKVEEKIDEIPF